MLSAFGFSPCSCNQDTIGTESSVRTMPGASALTRMPSRAHSFAQTVVSMIKAALLML